MAKKAAPSRRSGSPGRKSSGRQPKKTGTFRDVWLALGILFTVVLASALLVRIWLPPEPPPGPMAPTGSASRPAPPVQRQRPAPAAPAKAPPAFIYEVFPPGEVAPAAPPETPSIGRPRVALVIDDMGYDRDLDEAFLALDVPLTLAVLPYSPHGKSIAAAARRSGRQVMLHLPMEPEEYPRVDPGPGALLVAMTPDQLIDQLRRNLEQVPAAVGVNNHMGSRLTRESDRMNQIFSVLKERGLFFIDSRTTEKTLGYQSARLLRVPFAQRDVFLDHRQEPAFIRRQIEELVRRAETHGQAVGIGHPHPETLEVLRQRLPAIRQRVELVPAAEIVRTLS